MVVGPISTTRGYLALATIIHQVENKHNTSLSETTDPVVRATAECDRDYRDDRDLTIEMLAEGEAEARERVALLEEENRDLRSQFRSVTEELRSVTELGHVAVGMLATTSYERDREIARRKADTRAGDQ